MGKQKSGRVYICIGGQFGSEAKGLFVSHLIREKKIRYVVRTGSINAGHTVYYKGKPYKNQQIPVAWVKPGIKLVIGAGAYVCPEVLEKEIRMIKKATGRERVNLFIDFRCGAHLPCHAFRERGMHERMGSTGEGCSEAIKDKMSRRFDYITFAQTQYAQVHNGKEFEICDTVGMLNQAYDRGMGILLEGTQGTMLDLHLGIYPYTTSRQTVAANWLSEAGLSPNLNIEIAMVCRTFPIRVAGNSGPLSNEIGWVRFLRLINAKRKLANLKPLVEERYLKEFEQKEYEYLKGKRVKNPEDIIVEGWSEEKRRKYSQGLTEMHRTVLSKLNHSTNLALLPFLEMTTVTKKLRRIAQLDLKDLKYAVSLNRPDYLVFTFLNYKFPRLFTINGPKRFSRLGIKEKIEIKDWLKKIEQKMKTPIKYISWHKEQMAKVKGLF